MVLNLLFIKLLFGERDLVALFLIENEIQLPKNKTTWFDNKRRLQS